MIPPPSFFNTPFYYPYSNPYYNSKGAQKNNNSQFKPQSQCKSEYNKSNVAETCTSKNIEKDNNTNIIELFGLKLYFDDLLLIGLIYFLYKEEVHDNFLFIALILLLIS